MGAAKVLVVCQAAEQTIVRICQDQLAAQLRTLGVTPLMSDGLTVSADKSGEKAVAAARSLGAKAVFFSTLRLSTTTTSSGPSFGFGIGSGGYNSGGGVGMSFPIGGGNTESTTTYASDTTLTDVSSGKLMWSGKASTFATQEVTEQLAGLAKVSVESARKAGMI